VHHFDAGDEDHSVVRDIAPFVSMKRVQIPLASRIAPLFECAPFAR
jgi:hypothetical protein